MLPCLPGCLLILGLLMSFNYVPSAKLQAALNSPAENLSLVQTRSLPVCPALQRAISTGGETASGAQFTAT